MREFVMTPAIEWLESKEGMSAAAYYSKTIGGPMFDLKADTLCPCAMEQVDTDCHIFEDEMDTSVYESPDMTGRWLEINVEQFNFLVNKVSDSPFMPVAQKS